MIGVCLSCFIIGLMAGALPVVGAYGLCIGKSSGLVWFMAWAIAFGHWGTNASGHSHSQSWCCDFFTFWDQALM